MLRVRDVPYRRYRLGARYSRRRGVRRGNLGGGRREPCGACGACGIQADGADGKYGDGGLVGISDGGQGHVSVVGSTLTNIMV